jgi:transposase InsO family protein
MEAADHFYNPTTAPNQLWQTDFTYFKIKHWGWYYLSTVLDDYRSGGPVAVHPGVGTVSRHAGGRCGANGASSFAS